MTTEPLSEHQTELPNAMQDVLEGGPEHDREWQEFIAACSTVRTIQREPWGTMLFENFKIARQRARTEWQPIETAPKNSKARLLWVPENQSVFAAYWEQGGTPGYKPGWAIFGGGWREFLQGASHWLPLPPPPHKPETE